MSFMQIITDVKIKEFIGLFLFLLAVGTHAQTDTVRVKLAADTLSAEMQEGGFSPEALRAYNEGLAHFRAYRLDEALTAFSDALDAEPDFAKAYFNRAATYMEVKNYHRATADLDMYLLCTDSMREAYFLRARAHHLAGHDKSALVCYTEAIDNNARPAEAALYRAEIHFKAGRDEEAIADYTAGLSAFPDNAGARHDRGSAYMKTGRLNEAIADYNYVVRIKPGMARAHANLGAAQRKAGNLTEALAALNTAVRLEPDNAVNLNSRGFVNYLSGNYDAAEEDFRRALEQAPDYAYAHNNLAGVLIKKEDYEAAEKFAGKALSLENNYAQAYMNRGIAREMLRDMTGACADWRKAERMNVPNAAAYRSTSCKFIDQ